MANRPLPTPEILGQLLRYEPETGKLFWRERSPAMFEEVDDPRGATWVCAMWNSRFSGADASVRHGAGHYRVKIFHQVYLAHRVIWKMVHGTEPHRIDHRDLDGRNNRIGNLRPANVSQNGMNRGKLSSNTSGIKGVHFDRRKGKWVAQISANGKKHWLGGHDTAERAREAYAEAALRLHGEFARTS